MPSQPSEWVFLILDGKSARALPGAGNPEERETGLRLLSEENRKKEKGVSSCQSERGRLVMLEGGGEGEGNWKGVQFLRWEREGSAQQ